MRDLINSSEILPSVCILYIQLSAIIIAFNLTLSPLGDFFFIFSFLGWGAMSITEAMLDDVF